MLDHKGVIGPMNEGSSEALVDDGIALFVGHHVQSAFRPGLVGAGEHGVLDVRPVPAAVSAGFELGAEDEDVLCQVGVEEGEGSVPATTRDGHPLQVVSDEGWVPFLVGCVDVLEHGWQVVGVSGESISGHLLDLLGVEDWARVAQQELYNVEGSE